MTKKPLYLTFCNTRMYCRIKVYPKNMYLICTQVTEAPHTHGLFIFYPFEEFYHVTPYKSFVTVRDTKY